VLFFQPDAKVGTSGAGPPEGRKEGGALDPWVGEAQIAAPLNREEGELPHDEEGQETGRKRPDPPTKEGGRRSPWRQRGRSWPLRLFSLQGMLAKGVMTIRLRRAGQRGHSAWWPQRGLTGKHRPDPRLQLGREEGEWPGAKIP